MLYIRAPEPMAFSGTAARSGTARHYFARHCFGNQISLLGAARTPRKKKAAGQLPRWGPRPNPHRDCIQRGLYGELAGRIAHAPAALDLMLAETVGEAEPGCGV